jgi:protein-disulfide isomerase
LGDGIPQQNVMKSSDRLQNLMTGILVVCAVLVTATLLRREFASPRAEAAERAPARSVSNWREYAAAGQRTGPVQAPVTIVEFSDFQCPYCRMAAARLDSLRQEYPDQVAIVYRHFPLPNHPHAVAAARASECAGEQGRFWQMHDHLYARQDSIGYIGWARFATSAGVSDSLAFQSCISRLGPLQALERDTAAGNRLGVRATPTLLINGTQFVGAAPLDTLRAHVRQIVGGEPRGRRR